MQIVHRNPDRLVIVHRPWVWTIGVWITGAAAVVSAFGDTGEPLAPRAIAVVTGLFVMGLAWRLMPFHTLVFDRETGRLDHHLHRVSGTSTRRMPLGAIEWAKVEARWSDNSRGERLVLGLEGGRYPVEAGFGPTARGPVADAINDWLTEPPAVNSHRAS